jgi:hypothetical protein
MSKTFVSVASKSALAMASKTENNGLELKAYTALEGFQSIGNAFTLFNMAGVAAGTGLNQRVGRAVKLLAVEIAGWFSPSDNYQSCRLIVANRLSGQGTPQLTNGNYFNTPLNCGEEKMRYYCDDKIGFPPSAQYASSNTYSTVPYSRYISFGKGIDVRYASGGTITDNAMYVAFISDSSAVVHPSFTGYVRYFYTDP